MQKSVQWIISIICGGVATFIDAYGALLGFMIGAIVFDVLTGVLKSAKAGTLSSKRGTQGFCKKCIYFVTFFFGIFLDSFIPFMLSYISITLPFKLPFALIITFYIVLNECISICENIYDINPQALPHWVVNLLKIGKQKIENIDTQEEADNN